MGPDDAVKIREAMRHRGVEYLVIGKMAAVLHGFPDTTQDTDVFVEPTSDNRAKLFDALNDLGFSLDDEIKLMIRSRHDLVQLRGPVNIDIIFAPDGIEGYDDARTRATEIDGHPVCSIADIIKSKEATNRQKDRESLPRLRNFETFVSQQPPKNAKPLPRRPSSPKEPFTGTPDRQTVRNVKPAVRSPLVVCRRELPVGGKDPEVHLQDKERRGNSKGGYAL